MNIKIYNKYIYIIDFSVSKMINMNIYASLFTSKTNY